MNSIGKIRALIVVLCLGIVRFGTLIEIEHCTRHFFLKEKTNKHAFFFRQDKQICFYILYSCTSYL